MSDNDAPGWAAIVPGDGQTTSAAGHLYELIGDVDRLQRERDLAELREAHMSNAVRETLAIMQEHMEIISAWLDGKAVDNAAVARHCERLTRASERLIGSAGKAGK